MHSFIYSLILRVFYNDVIKRHCLLTTTDILSPCGVECGLEQRAVDGAIDQWRRRLLACVDAEGGHFEHNLGL